MIFIITEIDAITGIVSERDATTEEIAIREKDLADYKSYREAIENAANAKKAILDRLGLTAEEATILLG